MGQAKQSGVESHEAEAGGAEDCKVCFHACAKSCASSETDAACAAGCMKGTCAERCKPVLAHRSNSKLPARSRAGRVLDSHLRELHDAATDVQVSVKGDASESEAEPMTATARSNFMQTAARSARTTVKTVAFGGGATGKAL